MGIDMAFDPEAALRARFAAERAEEEQLARPLAEIARPLAASRSVAKKPSRSLADAGAFAAIAACLAIGVALPFRSPLIHQSGRAFAECARNGTFRSIGDRVSAISREAGKRLGAPRIVFTTEEP